MQNSIDVSVPDGTRGEWKIETFTVSDDDSKMTALRSAASGRDEYVPPGTYKRLTRSGAIVMSNTPMEIRTNQWILENATGRVLINGLGLGMVVGEILRKPDVGSVTVIEVSSEVISLVAPTFGEDPRVSIINANAFAHRPRRGERFDIVWHDIWDNICAENLPDMRRLHRKYSRCSVDQRSWCRSECEFAARRRQW